MRIADTPARPLIVLAALLSAAILVFGCGGGDDGDGGTASGAETTDGVTKAKFIAQADAACKEHQRQIRRAIRPYFTKQSSPDTTADEIVNEVLAPRLLHEIRTVRAYVLPPENVDQVLRFLEVQQQAVEKAQENPLAFTKEQEPFAKAERLAKEFGFKICGGL